MREAFHDQLRQLGESLIALAVQVKGMIAKAVGALEHLDAAAAREVIATEKAVDRREHELEGECLRLIALQQPMAGDLRAIGAGLRILAELERMADHATAIARAALRLERQGQPLLGPLVHIPLMAAATQEMVSRAVDAYAQRDAARARSLTTSDDQVDHLFSQVFRELLPLMAQDPQNVGQATELLFVASRLERIADHATNVAESTIYAVTGERVELND